MELKLKDYLSSINHDKKPLMDNDEEAIRRYPAYAVNRVFSYFPDTIFYANEMNCNYCLCNKSQFDFYRLGIRKKKRYSPWLKKEEESDIQLIKDAFGYTNQKAIDVLNILTPQDMEKIKKSMDTGGKK